MHLAGSGYEEVYRSFRWELPARLNIAAEIVDRHAARTPEAPALLVETADGAVETWTFAKVRETANRFANALVAFGVRRGDVVAIHLPQGVECLVAHVAVQKVGAVALPLFSLFGPDAIGFRLADSAAVLLVTSAAAHARLAGTLAAIASLRHVVVVGAEASSPAHEFWRVVAQGAASFQTADTAICDPALLMYTSGTTGNPKGVLHAQSVLLGHLPGVMVPHDGFPRAGDRFWTPADWAWAGGLLDVLLPSLYHGVPVVAATRSKFEPDWAFDFMARHHVRNVFLPPTALRLMRQVAAPRLHYAFALRTLGTGGETLGGDLIAWGRETFGLTIAEFFGQTEVNLVVGNAPDLFAVRPGSMGRAIPGHVVEIVDESGAVLPPGREGVVAVRRPDPVMFLGYWRQPAATEAKFRGHWCLLGDIAVKDADGYFWFKGRDDDVITSAGYRIGPGEVEECLVSHPAVALAGVVGAPDAVRGEAVTAYLVLNSGEVASPELAVAIQAHVRERLAAHEYPRHIRFVEALPMTITGKVRRVELRARERDLAARGRA
ncbi:MAG: AMP-binding protein [Hyphomicrobiaceae bacterium]